MTEPNEIGLRSTTVLSSAQPLQEMKDKVAKSVGVSKKAKKPAKKALRAKLARLLGAKAPLMATQYQIINQDDLKRFKLPRKLLGKQIVGKVTRVKVGKIRVAE